MPEPLARRPKPLIPARACLFRIRAKPSLGIVPRIAVTWIDLPLQPLRLLSLKGIGAARLQCLK